MKRLLVFFVVLLILFFGSIYVATRFFAGDLLQGSLEVLVEKHLSRKLVFHEDLQLSLVPFAVEAKNVSLLNPKSFGETPMFNVGHLSVRLRLIPFIQERKIVVDHVIMDRVDVILSRLSNGHHNWRFAAKGKPLLNNESEVDSGSQAAPISFEVNRVTLKDGRVVYDDAMSSTFIEAHDIQFSGSMRSFDEVLFSTSLQLLHEGEEYPINFGGQVGVEKPSVLGVKDIEISIRDNVLAIPSGSVSFETTRPFIKAQVSSKYFDFDSLKKEASGNPHVDSLEESKRGRSALDKTETFVWGQDAIRFPFALCDADVDLYLTHVVFNRIPLKEFNANVRLNKDRLSIKADDFLIADGKSQFLFNVDRQQNDAAKVHLRYWIDSVALSYFSYLVENVDFKGGMSVRGDLMFNGSSIGDWVRSLAGSGVVTVSDAIVHGLDGLDLFKNVVGKHLLKTNSAQTVISKLSATYAIQQGVLSNRDLKASLGVLEATGAGKFDIPELQLNYRLTPGVVVDAGTTNEESVFVPVDIVGPLTDLTFRPVVSALLPRTSIEQNVKKILNNPADLENTLRDMRKGFKEDRRSIGKALESVGKGILKQSPDVQKLEQLLKGF